MKVEILVKPGLGEQDYFTMFLFSLEFSELRLNTAGLVLI